MVARIEDELDGEVIGVKVLSLSNGKIKTNTFEVYDIPP